ncbi:hypothetical protein [Vibrio barjaei]|uniref:hypothetical protein n=1 Tax=Vibrio barjaei TaxID=1676683 RepID=UPI0022847913|nr:hypothetical protein [Vibrio barjaei]MCY9874622.1 hypothetical protein [Vibrio barjaei]
MKESLYIAHYVCIPNDEPNNEDGFDPREFISELEAHQYIWSFVRGRLLHCHRGELTNDYPQFEDLNHDQLTKQLDTLSISEQRTLFDWCFAIENKGDMKAAYYIKETNHA